MELVEKELERSVVYEGGFIRVRRDLAQLPNGKTAVREVVEHPGAVAVLPLDEKENVITVKQYRYPLGRILLEIPAGKLEAGEDHRLCALRELEEETGMTSGELTYLGCLYISPGFCSEIIHLYLARSLHQGVPHPDEDEFLDTQKVPFQALVEAVMNDEIRDAKTVAAVLKTKLLLGL